MKKLFGLVAIILAIGLIGCSMSIGDGEAEARFTHNGVTYTPVVARAEGNLEGRTNSSGISVPSNSHSTTFVELHGVYFTWVGNGQNRNFFAFADETTWDIYCWVGVTTQQGPHGYQFHRLGKQDGPAYVFEKLHNNITQAWLEGGQTHTICPGLCKNPDCFQCGNCLEPDCGPGCECVCDCPILPPPCTDCWVVGCCAIRISNVYIKRRIL